MSDSDASSLANRLRERLGDTAEDRLGKALSELLENPLITTAIGRAFDAREKASQAQEVAMGALNIPSAADIERLTRRLRSVSQRLEGIEDGMHKLDRAIAPGAVEERLAAIEDKLSSVSDKLDALVHARAQPQPRASARAKASAAAKLRRGAPARPGGATTDA
jgi:chromosome segregation ATPase